MKSYIKPLSVSLKDDALMIQAESQYSVFFTAASCPGNACGGDETFELGIPKAACFGPEGGPQEGSSVDVTCQGLDGTFHMIFESIDPNPEGQCGGGTAFIVVFTSPDLPADCIVTSLQTGQADQCTQSCDQ